jgi:hypothetical protein
MAFTHSGNINKRRHHCRPWRTISRHPLLALSLCLTNMLASDNMAACHMASGQLAQHQQRRHHCA